MLDAISRDGLKGVNIFSEDSFQMVPNELTVKILSYLSFKDLFSALRVQHSWYSLRDYIFFFKAQLIGYEQNNIDLATGYIKEFIAEVNCLIRNGIVLRSSEKNTFEIFKDIREQKIVEIITSRRFYRCTNFGMPFGKLSVKYPKFTHFLRLEHERSDQLHDPRFQGTTSALLICARANDVEGMQLLLNLGLDINQKDKGETALIAAVSYGHIDAVRFLLAHGADANIANSKGQTPLHIAAFSGNIEMCQALLDFGALINAEDDEARTPLFDAIKGGIGIVEFLIAKGASINLVSPAGRKQPLHYAAAEGNKEIVSLLLQHNAQINAEDTRQYTPMHYAVADLNVDIVNLLIDKGAPVTALRKPLVCKPNLIEENIDKAAVVNRIESLGGEIGSGYEAYQL